MIPFIQNCLGEVELRSSCISTLTFEKSLDVNVKLMFVYILTFLKLKVGSDFGTSLRWVKWTEAYNGPLLLSLPLS